MKGKRPLRRTMRQAQAIARLTGYPQTVTRMRDSDTLAIETVRDKLRSDVKPDCKLSRGRKTWGKAYYARHPRKKSTLRPPVKVVVYPHGSKLECPKPGKLRKWHRDPSTGRFAKHGTLTVRTKK
jgi:endonuclease YncB( thermonuclease family)